MGIIKMIRQPFHRPRVVGLRFANPTCEGLANPHQAVPAAFS